MRLLKHFIYGIGVKAASIEDADLSDLLVLGWYSHRKMQSPHSHYSRIFTMTLRMIKTAG